MSGDPTTGPQGQHRYTLMLSAEKTKTSDGRAVPVGARLAAVLTMRRDGPDGLPFGPDAYVFGNAVGVTSPRLQ